MIARSVGWRHVAALSTVGEILGASFARLVGSTVVTLLRTDILIRRPALLILLLRARLTHQFLPVDSPGQIVARSMPLLRHAVITGADQSHDT
jgi:hypothetical protein